MGFFDGLGEKIASTGKDVASKAKDVAEITRLKAEIAAHEGKIKNAYTEIGRLFYENADGEVAEAYVPLMEAVSNEKAALEKCKSDIHKIKGTTVSCFVHIKTFVNRTSNIYVDESALSLFSH